MKKIISIIISTLIILQMSLLTSAETFDDSPINDVLNFGTVTNVEDYAVELTYDKTISTPTLYSVSGEYGSEIHQLTVCKIITSSTEETEQICDLLESRSNARASGTLTEENVGGLADIYSTITYSTNMIAGQVYIRIISANGGVTRVEPRAQVTNNNVRMGQNGYAMGSGYKEQRIIEDFPYSTSWTLTPPTSFVAVAAVSGEALVGCTLTTTVTRGTGTFQYEVVNNIYEY